MKKWIVLPALALLAALTACGGELSAAEPVLSLGGEQIDVASASVDDALAALGDGYEYAEAVSCVYDGMDKTYTYPDAVVYTYPDGATDRLMEIYCTGGDVETPAGVAIGDTRDKVVETYGDGFTEAGATLAYEQTPESEDDEPASLYFELEGGKVTAIGATAEHRSE